MEVQEHAELFFQTGEDEFAHTTVIFKKGEAFFFAYSELQYQSEAEINPEELGLYSIPVQKVWAHFQPDFTRAPNPGATDHYVKNPTLLSYLDFDNCLLSDRLFQEAQVCETLRKFPHPNIAQYLGCSLRGNWITGL